MSKIIKPRSTSSGGSGHNVSPDDYKKLDEKVIDYIYVTKETVEGFQDIPVLYLRYEKTRPGADLFGYAEYKFWRLYGPVYKVEPMSDKERNEALLSGILSAAKTFAPKYIGKRIPPHENVVVYAVKPAQKLTSKAKKESNPLQYKNVSKALTSMNEAVTKKGSNKSMSLGDLTKSWLESLQVEFARCGLRLQKV